MIRQIFRARSQVQWVEVKRKEDGTNALLVIGKNLPREKVTHLIPFLLVDKTIEDPVVIFRDIDAVSQGRRGNLFAVGTVDGQTPGEFIVPQLTPAAYRKQALNE